MLSIIKLYKSLISPFFAPRCRYYPSCSTYAIQAIMHKGYIKGIGLAIFRLLRCNPFSKGGVDEIVKGEC